MKTFKEYCLTEHPSLGSRIKKLNPIDKIKDKYNKAKDAVKKFPGELKDKAVDKIKDKLDKVNLVKKINKKRVARLVDKKKRIDDKLDSLRDRVK